MGARGRSAGSAAGSLWVDAVTEHGSRSWDLSRRNPVTAGEESISSGLFHADGSQSTKDTARRVANRRIRDGGCAKSPWVAGEVDDRTGLTTDRRAAGQPGGGRAMAVGGGLTNRAVCGREGVVATGRRRPSGARNRRFRGDGLGDRNGRGTCDAVWRRQCLKGGSRQPEGWRAESRRNDHETGETMTAAGTRREHELPSRASGRTEWATFAGSASQRRRPDRCGQERPGQVAG